MKSFLLEILELWNVKESILPTYKYLTRKIEKGDYINKAVRLSTFRENIGLQMYS